MESLSIFGAATLIGLIIFAMVLDGRESGMLESKQDWVVFITFLATLTATAGLAYWIAGMGPSANRVANSIAMFLLSLVVIGAVLNFVKLFRHRKQRRFNGELSNRESNRRIDLAIKAISKVTKT